VSTKLVVGVLMALALAAQLIRVACTNPPVTSDVPAPAEVKALLRRACYDCHSHETVWPWYSAVAPTSWLVAHDVDHGRSELDFSTWDAYAAPKRAKLLHKSAEEMSEGEMPPWYYRLVQPEARLTADEVTMLRAWATEAAAAR
jgi:heme-binding protein